MSALLVGPVLLPLLTLVLCLLLHIGGLRGAGKLAQDGLMA